MGQLREDRVCRRGPRRIHAVRAPAVRPALDGVSDQPGECRRGAVHDRAPAQRVHRRGDRPDARAGHGQGSDPARGEGDRGLRRPPLGVAVLHAAGGLPARGGVQDDPPASPLPAAADGTADHPDLAGGRRGRAGAPARLDDAIDPSGCPPARIRPGTPEGPLAKAQIKSASSRSRADLGLAPTICLTTWPPENTFMVGMAMIPYRCATAGFWSMLSLTTSILSAYSVAISSRTGATMRHGPHHSAQ